MTEIKLAVFGQGGSGKSALTIQFIQNHFVEEYCPTIEDNYRKHIEIDEERYLLDILDTAGSEDWSKMKELYTRQGEGFLFLYSITSRESFEEVTREIEKIQKMKEKKDFPMVIVGNKTDLEKDRKISQNEAMDLAKTYNCPFFETSAKNNHNVQEAFLQLVREVNLYHSKNNDKKNQNTYKCKIL
ncbi:ras-like protein rasb [Anaeramoeba flamelloides]|uniref:Ras-like protein rasb n=1 Tax=Anaeramoeba flamelloides TaxID=1746091 RepID=A0ABQ8YSY5_9EUKA|nr:ras-like protein rasb [Anaeramoeba flamelloides]